MKEQEKHHVPQALGLTAQMGLKWGWGMLIFTSLGYPNVSKSKHAIGHILTQVTIYKFTTHKCS